jgi:uncharacterized protein (UPF0332 family)
MKPDAFFDFAEWTLQNNATPAGFRSVTSRAYYGAIHQAVAFLASLEVQLPSDVSIHSRVPDILDHADDRDMVEVATMLRALRSQRNEADYDLDKHFVETAGFASARLFDARKIIGRLRTLMLGKDKPGSKIEAARPSIVARAALLAEGPR